MNIQNVNLESIHYLLTTIVTLIFQS